MELKSFRYHLNSQDGGQKDFNLCVGVGAKQILSKVNQNVICFSRLFVVVYFWFFSFTHSGEQTGTQAKFKKKLNVQQNKFLVLK